MQRRCIWLLVALGTWLGGCGGIISEQPLGDEIAVFNPADLDGMWLGRDYRQRWVCAFWTPKRACL